MEYVSSVNVEKKRIAVWDNLKFILIFLVVFGHFMSPFTADSLDLERMYLFIYTFHMPAFIFVNGLFSKRAVREKDYKKVFEFIVLYLFIKVIIYTSAIFVGGSNDFEFSLISEKFIPWYALCLAEFYLITILLQDVDKKYLFLFSVFLACISGYDKDLGSFLSLSRTIVFYPFFYLGYCLDANKLYDTVNKMKYKLRAIAFFIVIGIMVYFFIEYFDDLIRFLNGCFPYDEIKIVGKCGALYRLIYYPIVFVSIFSLIAICPNKESIITLWGKRTLNVYALHYILRTFVDRLYNEGYSMSDVFGFGYWWIVPVSLFITIFFSLSFWVKPMNFILRPKWRK